MEIITINVLVTDLAFGERLGEAITENYKNILVNIFIKGEKVTPCDLTISDYKKSGSRLIRLTEKLSEVNKEAHVLYKYGNIKELASHIVFAYSEFTGRRLISALKNNVEIIGVISSLGGVGCTTFALGIAQELKRFHNKKILYLSLEDFESTNIYFDTTVNKKTLKEYLYYLCNYKRNLCSAIAEYILSDEYGVETFMPSIGTNPLLELDANEFILFINSLIEGGRYEVIIIDGGNKLDTIHSEAYNICDKLFFLEKENYEKKKYSTYLNHLCGENVEKKTIRVKNKYQEESEEFLGCTIPYDESCVEEEQAIKNIVLDTTFGFAIRKIITNLT